MLGQEIVNKDRQDGGIRGTEQIILGREHQDWIPGKKRGQKHRKGKWDKKYQGRGPGREHQEGTAGRKAQEG